MNNLQAQNKRLADVQRHDVAVADKYLQSTSKAYKGLVALINQFVLDHRSNSAMLLTQKPNKRDLKRLNGLVDDLDDNLSKQAKKRLKLYLSIAEISLNYYLQAMVGIQNITLHNEYSKISKTSLNEDYSKELEFQLSQLSMQRAELDQKKLIDFEQHEATIWDSHDIMIAAISASLVKMLRNIRRDELLSKMLPQAEFRRSILGSKYEPIKRVSGDLPINAYYQGEQYKMEQAYRDHSSRLMHTEDLEIFKSADIKTVTIVNEFVPCSECKSYVGQTYLLDEAPDLPIHYNCRCRLMAIENGISGDDLSLLLGVLAGLASHHEADEKDDEYSDDSDTDESENDTIDSDKLLPNLKNAVISEKKFTKYALDPNNPNGGADKAKVFKAALGYDLSNYQDLIDKVSSGIKNNEAVVLTKDQYGVRYRIDMPITGPNGKTRTVRTGWIIEYDNKPRMTTVFVKERKSNGS